jgi:fibronectin-binding autotransporter adhesin
MIMKKVLRTMALVAAVATAAFMTGCGDDNNNNNNNNNNNVVSAPAVAALQGKTFTFGNGDSLLLSAAGANFTYTPHGGVAQDGTYQYTHAGNSATIVTITAADGTQTTYNLVFTGAANGQYAGTITRTPQGGNPSASTTFNTSGTNNGGGGGGNTNTNTTTIIAPATITGKNYLVNGGTNGTVTLSFPSVTTYTVAAGGAAIETGTYTYTASTTTNTAVIQLNPTTAGETPNTVNLTFTSVTANAESGTVSESDGVNGTFTQSGTNGINTGGGGTTTAPTALHSLHVNSTGGPFVGANYSITLNGNGTSGTFDIGGGSTGSGTYTYSANGNNGTLILNYTSEGAAGDNDTMVMAFTSASGGNFTGSQKTGGVQHNDFTGTFDSAN